MLPSTQCTNVMYIFGNVEFNRDDKTSLHAPCKLLQRGFNITDLVFLMLHMCARNYVSLVNAGCMPCDFCSFLAIKTGIMVSWHMLNACSIISIGSIAHSIIKNL